MYTEHSAGMLEDVKVNHNTRIPLLTSFASSQQCREKAIYCKLFCNKWCTSTNFTRYSDTYSDNNCLKIFFFFVKLEYPNWIRLWSCSGTTTQSLKLILNYWIWFYFSARQLPALVLTLPPTHPPGWSLSSAPARYRPWTSLTTVPSPVYLPRVVARLSRCVCAVLMTYKVDGLTLFTTVCLQQPCMSCIIMCMKAAQNEWIMQIVVIFFVILDTGD